MKTKTTDFAKHLTNFLDKYLPNLRGYSPNTIVSYTITFKLFLEYMFRVHKIKANNITLASLNKDVVSGFLNWVEKQRKCSRSTRNNRLAALRSFFKYLQNEDIKNIGNLQELLSSVKIKKGEQTEVVWLTADELKLLFQQPDPTTRIGLRDAVLLELLYETAARVQELIDLRPCDFRFDNTATVRLFGKGSKERRIPLQGSVVKNLKLYMEKEGLMNPSRMLQPLFPNPQGDKLSRMAVLNIVKKYVGMAKKIKSEWFSGAIGCHTFRHSKAMHMLEAGINLVVIRDFLGHSSVVTTEIYARASDKLKREALAKLNPGIVEPHELSWKKDAGLLETLINLEKLYGV